jgi:hypothetical protein
MNHLSKPKRTHSQWQWSQLGNGPYIGSLVALVTVLNQDGHMNRIWETGRAIK